MWAISALVITDKIKPKKLKVDVRDGISIMNYNSIINLDFIGYFDFLLVGKTQSRVFK